MSSNTCSVVGRDSYPDNLGLRDLMSLVATKVTSMKAETMAVKPQLEGDVKKRVEHWPFSV